MLLPYQTVGIIEAGCDEAGRGCLAGPVFAAAVILPDEYVCSEINDSKQLPDKKRYELRKEIEENALTFAIGIVSPQEIDKINILNASFLAMHRAIEKLSVTPGHLLIDGNRFRPYPSVTHSCIIKGDSKYQSIAAASILAKTYRDDYMLQIHEEFPQYMWHKNKGYPTKKHRECIKCHGITKHHRRTFRLLDTQLSFEFAP